MIKSTLLRHSGSLNGLGGHDDVAQFISLYIYRSNFIGKASQLYQIIIPVIESFSTGGSAGSLVVFVLEGSGICRYVFNIHPAHSFGPSRRFPTGGHVMLR